MLALYDFVPRYCPWCGNPEDFKGYHAQYDYKAKCSHTCQNCGLHYQLANSDEILKAATNSGGDMHQGENV